MAMQTAEPTTKIITGEELLAMGDIGPCELIEGRIVMHSPTGRQHGKVESKFGTVLSQFVGDRKLGEVLVGEVGIYIRRNPDTVRAPDVIFISNERVGKLSSAGYLDVAPDLVVEVMSPDDRWSEITRKLREYFEAGVRLIWIANPATRSVYAYRSPTDLRQFGVDDTLPGDDILPGFSVPVATLFEE